MIYTDLDQNGILPVEQKGCRKTCQGTRNHLALDKYILRNCGMRRTNLCMAWINFKKAHDMIRFTWIIETLKMIGVADNLIDLVSRSMCSWKTNLFGGGKLLGTLNIKHGIVQGDWFSPLLFRVVLIRLTLVLRESDIGYKVGRNAPKLNHLLFMDDLKIFKKDEKEIDSMIQTIRVCSEDIKMEFGITNCASVTMKRGKRVKSTAIRLPNDEEIAEAGNEGYKYLGILDLDDILCNQMKRY